VERLIGSARRECIDKMIVFGETHLRRIVSMYASYYNGLVTLSSVAAMGWMSELTLLFVRTKRWGDPG
jgi:hypothetical protein